MPQRTFHVSQALESDHDTVTHIMEGGTRPDVETLISSEGLLTPVNFRGVDYTHLTVDRFQTAESPWLNEPNRVVDFSPGLALQLKTHAAAEKGLVTQIQYADFALEPMYFGNWDESMAIGRFLLPKHFIVYRGHNFAPETDDILGADPRILGGADELGDVARLAGQTITVASELVNSIGFTALGEHSS